MRRYAWLTLREAYRYFGRNRYILAEMIRGAPKRKRETYRIDAYSHVEEEHYVVVLLMPDEWPGDDSSGGAVPLRAESLEGSAIWI